MKINPDITGSMLIGLMLCVSASKSFSQNSFINLDFESAVMMPTSGDPYNRVQFESAFPGWIGYIGMNAEALALYNNLFLDSTGIGLHGIGAGINFGRIDGNYTAMLQARYELFSIPPRLVEASLSQTGLVPLGSQSLQFKANASGSFQLSLNGEVLRLVALQSTPDYVLYGADITMFGGTSAEMRFTALPTSRLFFDNIQFSAQPVPEPGTVGLFILGGLVLGLARWRSRLKR